MKHDPLQEPELIVEGGHGEGSATMSVAEELRTQGETCRGCTEHADANWLVAMPEQNYAADEAEPMGAVMPPSEVRPIGDGAGREPKVVVEADPFFFTAWRSTSMWPSP